MSCCSRRRWPNLSGLPLERVAGYVHDQRDRRLPRALRQGRAAGDRPIRRSARRIEAMREGVLIGEPGGAARLKRRMVERVLDALRRRAAGRDRAAARAAAALRGRGRARGSALFCDDLVAPQRLHGRRTRSPPIDARRAAGRAESSASVLAATSGDARDLLEHVRPVAVFLHQEFVGDLAQLPGERWRREPWRRSGHIRGRSRAPRRRADRPASAGCA